MSNTDIDRILEDLLFVLPVFHKRLLRMDLGGVMGNLTRLHLAIMGMLRESSKTVSDLGKESVVSKSQMTHLIDQLVELGIVERNSDQTDRRVINLALTSHGRKLLEDLKQRVRENIRDRLAILSSGELTEMARAMETLRNIGTRL